MVVLTKRGVLLPALAAFLYSVRFVVVVKFLLNFMSAALAENEAYMAS